jgi:type I restriction enzyme R subunit
MTPEEKARKNIDRQLQQCGWLVQDADYMLYVDGKAIGVVEAKPEGYTLTGVETQSTKYEDGLPSGLPAHRTSLPFALRVHGSFAQFTNALRGPGGRLNTRSWSNGTR